MLAHCKADDPQRSNVYADDQTNACFDGIGIQCSFFDVLVISLLLRCRDYLGLHRHLHIMYIAKCNITVFLT